MEQLINNTGINFQEFIIAGGALLLMGAQYAVMIAVFTLNANDIAPEYITVESFIHSIPTEQWDLIGLTMHLNVTTPTYVLTTPAVDPNFLNICHYHLHITLANVLYGHETHITVPDVPNNISMLRALVNGLARHCETLFVSFDYINNRYIPEDLSTLNPEDALNQYKIYLGLARYLEQLILLYDNDYVTRIFPYGLED